MKKVKTPKLIPLDMARLGTVQSKRHIYSLSALHRRKETAQSHQSVES